MRARRVGSPKPDDYGVPEAGNGSTFLKLLTGANFSWVWDVVPPHIHPLQNKHSEFRKRRPYLNLGRGRHDTICKLFFFQAICIIIIFLPKKFIF